MIPSGQVLMLKFFPESRDNPEKGNFVMEVNNQNNETQNYQKPQNYQNPNFQNQSYGEISKGGIKSLRLNKAIIINRIRL